MTAAAPTRSQWPLAWIWPSAGAGMTTLLGYCIVLSVGGVEPFGNRSMMVLDLYGQYGPYMAHLHHVFTGHGGAFLAWPAALGTNFLALFTYYLASPLTMLISVVPTRYIPEAVEVVTVAKVVLAAVCMTPFLLSHAPQRRVIAVAFASAYALMSYNVVYSLNVMWLDATFLLPLICLAVDRMLAGGGRFPLALVLGYTWLTCFYTGYPATLAGGCYLVARLLMRAGERRGVAEMAKHVGSYVAATLVGVATAGVLLVPMLRALRLRPPQPSTPHGLWPLAPTPLTFLAQHLTGAFDSIRNDGSPNVTVGFAVVVAAVMFFASAEVPRRTRLAWGGLLALLAASMCVPELTWAWQGFGEAHWYLYRFSFVYSFLLVTIGFLGVDAALRATAGSNRVGLAVASGTGLIIIGVSAWRGAHVAGAVVLADALLCVLLPVAVAARHRAVASSRGLLAALVIAVLVGGDGIASASVAMSGRSKQFPFQAAGSWRVTQQYEAPAQVAEGVAGPAGRVAFSSSVNLDETLWFDVPGVDLYATYVNGQEFALLHALGLALQPGSHNWIMTTGSAPLSEAVLGIRALVDDQSRRLPELESVRQMNVGSRSVVVDRVLTGGSLGYVAPPTVTTIPAPGYGAAANPFTLAEDLLGAPRGTLATPAVVLRTHLDNVARRPSAHGVGYRLLDATRKGTVTWTLRASGSGTLYAHVGTQTFGRLQLRVGRVAHGYPGVADNGVIGLGQRTGEVDVSLVLSLDRQVDLEAVQFATVDPSAVERYVAKLPTLTHLRRGDRSISGDVTSPGGVLVLSVPYDGGWTARVDGRHESVRRVAGGFFGVALTPGHHRVQLVYLPPGFTEGLLLTALGVASLLTLAAVEWSRRRIRPPGVPEGAGPASPGPPLRSPEPAPPR